MKKIINISYCIFILSLLSFKSFSEPFVDRVIAIVGKNIILESDIQKAILQLESEGKDLSEYSDLECFVFDGLLFENLLYNQANLDSIQVSDEEINSNVEQRLKDIISQIGSIEEVEQFYDQTEEEIKNQAFEMIRKQLLAQKLRHKIVSDVDITPEEVRIFFEKIPEDEIEEIDEKFELAQIVLKPKLSEDSKNSIVEKLKQIRSDILEGSSFRSKAALYSEDPGSSSKGGEYRGVKRGSFVKEFESVAFNLEEGEISEPVETDFGFHIIQLIKRRGDELDLRHILLRPKYNPEEIEETQKKIDSIKYEIDNDSITFENAVRRYSEDKNTKFNSGLIVNYAKGSSKISLEDLSPITYEKVKDLEIGEISEPVMEYNYLGQEEFKIYLVKNKISPHKINFRQDYDKIKDMALQEKREKIINQWKTKTAKVTFIKVQYDGYNCGLLDWLQL